MSPSSADNGDTPAVVSAGYPDPASQPRSSGAAPPVRQVPGMAAYRPSAVRSPQEFDYRLRGLSAEPTGHVTAAPARTDRPHGRRRGPLLAKVAVLLGLAALAALLLQAFVIRPFSVPGNAMTPTLQPGDRIIVVKSGTLEAIRRGQIVVFHPPRFLPCTIVGGRGGDLALRVVALPGQTIWSVAGTIFVDGRPLHERGWYSPRSGQVGSAPIRRTRLAQGQYFVMADNRSDACDSRVFGPIAQSSIVGEGLAVVVRHGHLFLRRL
jgi:signal peptidase I